MSRYLIIANETVGGDGLVEEVRRRAGSDAAFHVVVPGFGPGGSGGSRDTGVEGRDQGAVVAGGGPTSAGSFADPTMTGHPGPSGTTGTPPDDTTDAGGGGDVPAREKARVLLEHVLSRLEGVANDVTGEVGQPDAIDAARDALAAGSYDEVILATPGAGASKVVGQDLPSRLENAVDVPVTTVHAERADPQATE